VDRRSRRGSPRVSSSWTGYKTALTQIVSVTRASLKDQSAIQRQGTKGGQVDVDAQRAALDRRTLEKRRREYELGNEYKTRNAVELADVKRHNASLIAADQQGGVRRTVLIRTMLNNMTRINQTALSGILSMWKSHQQRKLQDEASFNRRAEMELQSSMSRRTSIIRSATKEQVAAQQQAMTPSDKFNQASSTGVLGVATGRSYALGGLIGGAMGARTAYNILGEFQFIETAFKGIFDEVEGRAPKTQEFLKTMQDFARESPYDFEQVARSAQKMFATRVVDLEELGYDKATDSVINRLQVLADAAAASGKTSAQMELALNGLGQIGSVGQLMMEETRQVTENLGLPIEEVAKSLNMTVAELRDAMKAGEIDAETGLNAMFDAMTRIPGAAGAAARQARTLRGAMSQLADVGKQMMVQFLMPVAKGFTAIALAFTNVGGALVSSGGGWKVVRDGLRGVIARPLGHRRAQGRHRDRQDSRLRPVAAVSAPVITGFAVLVGLLSSFDGVRETLAALAEGTKNWFLVGYRAKAVVDDFSGFVKVMTTIGKFARTVQDFTKALVVGTKDWFLVGYRISGVIDEFSNIVLFQTSLGAAARVIVNALRGIWDALGALANTRDFGEFRKAPRQDRGGCRQGVLPHQGRSRQAVRLGRGCRQEGSREGPQGGGRLGGRQHGLHRRRSTRGFRWGAHPADARACQGRQLPRCGPARHRGSPSPAPSSVRPSP
jgi:tape measure domain-containing protein